MDPDEGLKQLRSNLEFIQLQLDLEGECIHPEEYEAVVSDVVDLFNGMDTWMKNGGFPPEAWNEHRYCNELASHSEHRCCLPKHNDGLHIYLNEDRAPVVFFAEDLEFGSETSVITRPESARARAQKAWKLMKREE